MCLQAAFVCCFVCSCVFCSSGFRDACSVNKVGFDFSMKSRRMGGDLWCGRGRNLADWEALCECELQIPPIDCEPVTRAIDSEQ